MDRPRHAVVHVSIMHVNVHRYSCIRSGNPCYLTIRWLRHKEVPFGEVLCGSDLTTLPSRDGDGTTAAMAGRGFFGGSRPNLSLGETRWHRGASQDLMSLT